MFVDFRPTSRLRGAKAIDAAAAIGPVFEALCEDSVDLAHLRMVCDWIQYRANFRDVVDLREILPPSYPGIEGATAEPARADELRDRHRPPPLRRRVARAPEGHHPGPAGRPPRRALAAGRRTAGARGLAARQPVVHLGVQPPLLAGPRPVGEGDRADVRVGAARRRERRPQHRGGAGADPRHVQLVGPAGGPQRAAGRALRRRARRRATATRPRPGSTSSASSRRRRAASTTAACTTSCATTRPTCSSWPGRRWPPTRQRVSSFVLDATKPTTALAFLRYKVFLVYISNVYDNLPTDEVARIDGRSYLVETRAYLPGAGGGRRERALRRGGGGAAGHHREAAAARARPCWPTPCRPSSPPPTTRSTSGAGSGRASASRSATCPWPGSTCTPSRPGVSGELLRPILESGGDIRMHVNNGAVASFVDTLPLLHPYGRLLQPRPVRDRHATGTAPASSARASTTVRSSTGSTARS